MMLAKPTTQETIFSRSAHRRGDSDVISITPAQPASASSPRSPALINTVLSSCMVTSCHSASEVWWMSAGWNQPAELPFTKLIRTAMANSVSVTRVGVSPRTDGHRPHGHPHQQATDRPQVGRGTG